MTRTSPVFVTSFSVFLTITSYVRMQWKKGLHKIFLVCICFIFVRYEGVWMAKIGTKN